MASSLPLIGSVDMWASNFAPRGWSFCSGQLVAISTSDTLFSLLGTIYGGDGRTTFGLPDLRGRIPIGEGRGPGLTNHVLGQSGGSETITLSEASLPIHNHAMVGSFTPRAGAGTGLTLDKDPSDKYYGQAEDSIYTDSTGTGMGPSPVTINVENAGSSQPVEILQPYLGVNYIIAVEGEYPSRN